MGHELVAELDVEAPVRMDRTMKGRAGLRLRERGSGASILVAEDDAHFLALLEGVLRKEGYRVTTCTHGINLLGHLAGFRMHGAPEHFDLVISDVRMPALSGLEVLEELQPKGKMPPTILMTAFDDRETHAKAERAGAVACLDKPFEVDDLLAEVRKVLG